MDDVIIKDSIYLGSVDSTNLYCFREMNTIESGTIIVADLQTGGKGRHGRTWYSPEGVNLYASILIKSPPTYLEWSVIPQITCLAIYRTVKYYGVEQAWIKWPNDVYVNESKIAGVLSECSASRSRIDAFIIGLGVNLNMDKLMLENIDKPATSIYMETGKQIRRDKFLHSLTDYFNTYCQQLHHSGRDGIYQAWRSASKLLNQTVTLSMGPEKTISGKVLELNPDGSILVESESGERNRFISGDISLSMRKTS